jgi:hypothetical protein
VKSTQFITTHKLNFLHKAKLHKDSQKAVVIVEPPQGKRQVLRRKFEPCKKKGYICAFLKKRFP